MKYKKFLPVLLTLPLILIAGCNSNNGNQQEGNQQQADTTQMEIVLPLPYFQNSEIRMEFIQEEAIQAFGLSSTSFFFNSGTRDPIQVCASVGLPIPVDSSLSNPWQVSDGGGLPNTGSDNVAIGNMDPNGLYIGETTGTYVECKTANGGTYLVHAEEFVHAVTAQAYWDQSMNGGQGGIHVVGQPEIPDCSTIKQVTVSGKKEMASICTRPKVVPVAIPSPSKT